ncbi:MULTISPECIES: hypothetical protein [unclassified Streptomyces]|uniref:hypothetical protein n=1 Tax=unclassified Streptomyces TaxID=2593676 RepID=UPI001160E375|nr:hypothetical protein [Streptomyces sp. CB01580]
MESRAIREWYATEVAGEHRDSPEPGGRATAIGRSYRTTAAAPGDGGPLTAKPGPVTSFHAAHWHPSSRT